MFALLLVGLHASGGLLAVTHPEAGGVTVGERYQPDGTRINPVRVYPAVRGTGVRLTADGRKLLHLGPAERDGDPFDPLNHHYEQCRLADVEELGRPWS